MVKCHLKKTEKESLTIWQGFRNWSIEEPFLKSLNLKFHVPEIGTEVKWFDSVKKEETGSWKYRDSRIFIGHLTSPLFLKYCWNQMSSSLELNLNMSLKNNASFHMNCNIELNLYYISDNYFSREYFIIIF